MNWVHLTFDIAFAIVATILSVLGYITIKAIRHLKIGKSFWLPIFVSGILFLFGSIITIFQEVNFSIIPNTNEAVYITQLFALCFLVISVYSYHKKIKESLTTTFAFPEKSAQESLKIGVVESESKVQDLLKTVSPEECKHQFGYLQTLSRDALLPFECLSCDRLMKCKGD
jgi:hypothetical protein